MSIILHIDMNSYFASVEQQANPHLRGRPVGVCEHLGGIIIAPSVEAKRKGIKLGTPVWEAIKIDPRIVLLHTDPDKYRSVTNRFIKILRDYTDDVERYSIDEAFMDISRYCNDNWNEALLLALEIKQRLRLEVGEWVSCSIGIGPNKIISKVAADLDGGIALNVFRQRGAYRGASDVERKDDAPRHRKPIRAALPYNDRRAFNLLDRICLIKPEQVELLCDYLDLTDVPGIGQRLEAALGKMGIHNLRELADYPVNNLINRFGINGFFLHEMANFRDASEVVSQEEPNKSIGHAYTVPRAIEGIKEIRGLMYKLSEKVGRRMRRYGAQANIIHYFHSGPPHPTLSPRGRGIKGEGQSFHRQRKIHDYVDDGRDIFRAAWKIYKESLQFHSGTNYSLSEAPLKRGEVEGIKIMGISVSGLRFHGKEQMLIKKYQRLKDLVKAADLVNDKYGEYTLSRGLVLRAGEEWVKDTVGFGRVVKL